MDQATLNRIRERISPHVINIYGTTETGSCSAGTVMFEEDMTKPGKLSSVGKPLLNADLRVIVPGGDADDEVPPGEAGEVIIRGPSVAGAVWDDAEATRRIFRGPWWYSGDLGRIDADGYLFLEGRTDDMIVTGGINVLPARVEGVLLTHPSVAEVAVVGVLDETWGQRITAFVVCKAEGLDAEQLDRFVRDSDLSDYQRPRSYVMVPALPRTATGKLDRRALRTQGAVV
jgi:acyl-CoA synthetase (AMP-forming)/AMP-acid ligase II